MPDAGPDIDLCLGTTAMLDGSGMGTYQWTPPAGLDNPTVATPITSVTSNTIYVLAVTDAAGCTDYDTVDVRVITPPVTDVLPTDLFVCPNEEIQLMATGGVSYSWMPTDGLDDPFIADPLLTATIGGTYDVIVYNASGCSDTASVNVVLDALPDVDAGDQQIIDLGTTITLNGFTDGVDFSWSPDEFLSDATVLNPDAFPETTTWFVLEATSEAGCLFADSVRIIVVEPPSIIIPNAFTPNGDGLHDILSPVATRDVEDEAHFRIYNRWGELVYESFDVNSGWDGTVNGKPQEIGSYVYIFVGTNARGEQYTLNGTITLLR
jgi:gliding motility-associated-like protein